MVNRPDWTPASVHHLVRQHAAVVAKRLPWSLRLVCLVLASVVLLLAMSGVATWNLRAQRIEGSWVAHSNQVRYELLRVSQLLIEAQAGARGFALGSAPALQAYAESTRTIDPTIKQLQQLVADNPKQRPLAAELEEMARDLETSNAALLSAARSGDTARLSGLMSQGQTDEVMAKVRANLATMEAEEERLLVERRLTRDRARRDAALALWATGVLGVFLLLLIVYFTRRDEAKLHRAERELATTLRSIGDAVIATDAVGAIRFMNPIAEALTGWDERSAQGLPVARVFQIIGEDSRARVDSPERLVLQEGKTVRLANHTVLIARDGTERAIADSGAPILDETGQIQGMVLVFRDVSEARSAERALRVRDTEWRIINDYARFPVAHCDARHRFLSVNKAYADRFGLRPEDCVGKHIREITGEHAYERIRGHIEEALTGLVAEFELEIPYGGTNGSRWMHCIYAPVRDDEGRVVSFVAAVSDVTDRINVERELRRSKDALQETARLKDEFIATLSHELRNPLAPIRTAAKLLSLPQLSPTQLQRAQGIIERQVTHMALLLDDLLDIARITQGKLQLKKERVALVNVIDAAVEAARPIIDAKDHHLAVNLPDERIELEADPVRLSQVLSNLLTNAAKYSDPGGHIEVVGAVQEGTLVLSVKDDGIGIAPESFAGIFDMFSQVESVSGRSEGGLGIGLALVKGLTELHAGTVQVRSAGLGHGSEFIVRLPLVALDPVVSPNRQDTATAPAQSRVLVVDDNRDAAESLSMLLEMAGHEVRVAHLGRAALSLAQTFRPEVVLLDIGMPDLSGYEIAQALRGESWGQDIQLIALTGWGQERDRQQALKAGFNEHLTKPIDPDRLTKLIAGRGSAQTAQSQRSVK